MASIASGQQTRCANGLQWRLIISEQVTYDSSTTAGYCHVHDVYGDRTAGGFHFVYAG
ncbi:hypothetical protein GCM10017655_39540 [Pseudomonas turukhanskensis]|uniref:Uncharacterized protein n=1 Tax=Pseudomonas turukhanskensis TaxID=1806536 RepID=A0A9W6KAX4_9PSED|nr:hypothetical protein GCM10017655_39540 [Pseudomonas turukhanskensis]